VVNNVDVKCETAPDAIRDALVRQLYSPVQWTKTVEFMAAQGVSICMKLARVKSSPA
jgi:[acyl-carrier-protein] S-malonyltransferase